jgi:tRNA1(Val) A37 N6-methylase TrmN6
MLTLKNNISKNKNIEKNSLKNTLFYFTDNLDELIIKKCFKNTCGEIKINKPILMTDKLLINKIYDDNIRKTVFDNVSVILDNNKYSDIFGTNIDTILLCNSLKKYHELFKNINNFLELGIGGGFISKYIASKFKIKEGVLIDINPQCITYAIKDLNLPKLKNVQNYIQYKYHPFKCKIVKKNGYIFMQGDGLKILNHYFYENNTLLKDKLDLIVCNPPYIPSSSTENDLDINSPNFWEGTRLLRYLILNFNKFSKSCVCIVSSLSLVNKYVIDILSNSKFKLLDTHLVPIKVYTENGNILDDPKKLKLLLSKKKTLSINKIEFKIGAIKDNYQDNYPYYHYVNILYFYT